MRVAVGVVLAGGMIPGPGKAAPWTRAMESRQTFGGKLECLPGACPAHYLCIKYPISSPKFILTQGSPTKRPH